MNAKNTFILSFYLKEEALLTQADLFPWVGRQQEDQQGHRGEEHTWNQEIESIKQGPPP